MVRGLKKSVRATGLNCEECEEWLGEMRECENWFLNEFRATLHAKMHCGTLGSVTSTFNLRRSPCGSERTGSAFEFSHSIKQRCGLLSSCSSEPGYWEQPNPNIT